ncbi:hypothetical protein BHM03_00038116 [Ensete ventricosum]|nr:hypothetical protein BHM03_00038116 [Ensete ventricosum]
MLAQDRRKHKKIAEDGASHSGLCHRYVDCYSWKMQCGRQAGNASMKPLSVVDGVAKVSLLVGANTLVVEHEEDYLVRLYGSYSGGFRGCGGWALCERSHDEFFSTGDILIARVPQQRECKRKRDAHEVANNISHYGDLVLVVEGTIVRARSNGL